MVDPHEVLTLAGAPSPVTASAVAREATAAGSVIVVLDDDPTGTQSVHGLPVLTRWSVDDLRWAFEQGTLAVYVLTNTRSLDPAEAEARNAEVVRNARTAAGDRPLVFASRGDSTLRGHYPLEPRVLDATLQELGAPGVDGVVIVPAFPDAGRVTVGGVHYMRSGTEFTPVAETEFARDATFGYRNSDLRAWVEEKTEGQVTASDVTLIDLALLRGGDTDAVTARLMELHDAAPVVVDAESEEDLRVLSLALITAERRGRRFVYRVGPPFVRARIGMEARVPLDEDEIRTGTDAPGGLVVVGSHVALTTRQLAALVDRHPGARVIELNVDEVLAPSARDAAVARTVDAIVEGLADHDVVLHTSRLLRLSDDPATSLAIAREVSAALVRCVSDTLGRRAPRFVVAKGGITSSDVASLGLGIHRALVRGPMLPGLVSLWEPVGGPATGIPYVVFAGNVGADDSLAEVVDRLSSLTTRPGDGDPVTGAPNTGVHP
ncbi:four-carbon acid sugar kinase family protein [Nocardiopsis prasina]|uniref:four-carbon acid sugar kinase family protein n=1 Tax=Nocardiopsis prasina TaxID=2015 RepID=UPI000348D4C4|nr:four-carbon acid sugar kinase family protein [Nocardiopsis prasina]